MRRRTQTRRKLDDNQKAASNGSDDGNVPVGSGSMVSMKGMRCAVTGGSGFVGQRLVEMALQCGASLVVSFDISPQPQYSRGNAGEEDGTKTDEDAIADLIRQCEANGRLVYVQGDITKLEDVELMVCGGMGQQLKKPPKPVNEAVDIVFHIAALVGPFHKQEAYEQVNYQGTVNVIEACKIHGVTKIVMSSSPSTRFDPMNLNINGLKEDDLMFPDERNPPRGFTAEYARTKAMGERRCRSENGSKVYNVSSRAQKRRGSSDDNPGTLMTVAVAPHQVYGPRDGLFLPNLLNAAGTGKLRIFGSGNNLISMTHVDNYCHALLLAGKQLFPGSKILGKFYIATDGGSYQFWEIIDDAVQVGRHEKSKLIDSDCQMRGHVQF